MTTSNPIPLRSEVPTSDTWDLSTLFVDDAAWERAFAEWTGKIVGFAAFRNKLGESPIALAECLRFDSAFDRFGDRLGTYAFLKETEDVSNSHYQGMKSRYMGIAAQAAEAASFIRPEILSIAPDVIAGFLESKDLAEYKLSLQRLLRYRPHILSIQEERLLAMQMETAQTPRNIFDQLVDADLKFGTVEIIPGQTIELSHSSYMVCLEQPDREVRKKAFHQYYDEFEDHANTLAAILAGSIKQDVYHARVKNFPSAREASLFPDLVPVAVYDNLIASVRSNLPAVHRFYDVRKRAMQLPDIHFYDTYVPILSGIQSRHSWDEAVELVLEALQPLGPSYIDTLATGLRGRWCDRYENKGKHSGAFSSGCYDSDPFILMNYQPDVFDHVFTLAHEAGHSMQTYYSALHQPYQYANYTIFVAEVASTFNEQLLSRFLRSKTTDNRERAYYINREIDDIRKTIVRQTMFAEFENITHRLAEANEPLTLETFRNEYRLLLNAYFGPDFVLDDELSFECLRIPHFYRAFYVYKYATGLSAAISLSERVIHGGAAELEAYLGFLQGGSSRDPLELLQDAGVNMLTPDPIDLALKRFSELVTELDGLLPTLNVH